MRCEFAVQLAQLGAQAKDPIDLERLQNAILKQSLEQMRVQLKDYADQLRELIALIHRRTSALSPAKAYDDFRSYAQTGE